jgi:glycosyltransferase involved in cell wall biosynthesis
MLSIIIPTYNDPYLQKTIDSILENAVGEIEIIPILDGYTPPVPIKSDPRVKVINIPQNLGMRAGINIGLEAADGDYVMKVDAHCAFDNGFDKTIVDNCAENWLMIPRRYSLDVINWKRGGDSTISDYHYLGFPTKSATYGTTISIQNWHRRTWSRLRDPKYEIDDTMMFQGSLWVANKKFFMKQVGFLDDNPKRYGPWSGDGQEIGLKYWLGGAEVKVIKKTWYAHLVKRPHQYKQGLFSREYKTSRGAARGHTWTAKHWMNNEEPGMKPISWLIEKFWPVPGWPEDRKKWVFPE